MRIRVVRALTSRPVLSTTELMAWTHALALYRGKRSRREVLNHQRSIRRVAEQLCVRVGRGTGRGRPWLWRLKTEALGDRALTAKEIER